MATDTWLKLYTGIITSNKWVALPSNEHRHAYVTLLVLAKKRLLSAPVSYKAGLTHVTEERFLELCDDLVAAGLLVSHEEVSGFEDSQLTPAAARKRRQRERDRERDVTCDMSREKSREKQKAEAEADNEEKNPPSPQRGEQVPVARIVEAFNEIVRPARKYQTKPVNKAIERLIKARWREGMREEDFREVTRVMLECWGSDEKMAPYVRPHTLWSGKMESYLVAGRTTAKQDWKTELALELKLEE